MKNTSLNLTGAKQKANKSMASILRYHIVISIIAIAGFLIYAVLTVNMILNSTTDPDYVSSQQEKGIKTRFDDETIAKINDLRSRLESPSLELPDGRRNPFVE